ncbi:MAG: tripartite tricarboxylate transporter substrate binding protein [Rhizobiales bacterium]|nr:tripartite tricarboxylate transporter substrate binding protein [Hyphomicrobiales bacterium]
MAVLRWLMAGLGLFAGTWPLAAQEPPRSPIVVTNPYAPGSVTDMLARALSTGLGQRLGSDVTVVNRPGAGGAIGAAEIAQAVGDGQHLLFAPALVVSVLPSARSDFGYTPQSLLPVCQTFTNAMALAVRADSSFTSLAELVQAARAAPGDFRFGHPGPATIPHLAMEELIDLAAVDIAPVSFTGDQSTIEGLLAGNTDVASVVLGTAIAAGPRVRVLAVFADERQRGFADVPTVKELGFDVSPASFGGLFAPASTPSHIVSRLAGACEWAARSEPYVSEARRLAQPEGYYANVATFRHRIQRDIEVKRRLLTKLGAMQ